jgi:hypothetical protein
MGFCCLNSGEEEGYGSTKLCTMCANKSGDSEEEAEEIKTVDKVDDSLVGDLKSKSAAKRNRVIHDSSSDGQESEEEAKKSDEEIKSSDSSSDSSSESEEEANKAAKAIPVAAPAEVADAESESSASESESSASESDHHDEKQKMFKKRSRREFDETVSSSMQVMTIPFTAQQGSHKNVTTTQMKSQKQRSQKKSQKKSQNKNKKPKKKNRLRKIKAV